MKVRLTTLTENSVGRAGVMAEHGLAVLVEAGGKRILFDTGLTSTATHNAYVLGIDLGLVDAIVLSHSHADHTGGLRHVLPEVARGSREVDVVAHPDIWSGHYSTRKEGKPVYAGIPFRREELESLGARLCLERSPVELAEGVLTTGQVPMVTPFESVDQHLVTPDGAGWRPDEMLDDQGIVVRTDEGLVVVLGCAHRGMVNTLEHARHITGEERIYAVIGGTHLAPVSENQLQATIAALRGMGIQKVGVSHCTGLPRAARLALNMTRTPTAYPLAHRPRLC